MSKVEAKMRQDESKLDQDRSMEAILSRLAVILAAS